MAVDVDIDVEVLRCEIKKTYARVSERPDEGFIFPTGRAWALDLDYPADLLARVPDGLRRVVRGRRQPVLARAARSRASACSTSAPAPAWTRSSPRRWSARRQRHRDRHDRRDARAGARKRPPRWSVANVEFVEGEAESLPFADASFDVVISNGVIDLVPDKDVVFSEIFRVLSPGGRIQIADVTIQRPVSEEAPARHRPLGRLNRRRSAGGRVRRAAPQARLRADRDRQPRRHLRPLGLRGHAPPSGEVRRPRHDREGVPAVGGGGRVRTRPYTAGASAGRLIRSTSTDAASARTPNPTNALE